MASIRERLFGLQDIGYADFQSGIVPNIDRSSFIGVRVPDIRRLAKELKDDPMTSEFLSDLPHKYYDENILHSIIISRMKDYDICISEIERFLPYIDNWAVCDILSPKVFSKHKDCLLSKIKGWISTPHSYTCRFGMLMLMTFYLDDDFRPEYLRMPAEVVSEEYYVNMMIAWFFATALAKQWDSAIPYIEERRMPVWVHNKTIQKALESYRITDEQKQYLRKLRISRA